MEQTQTETQYRIHWRNETTGATPVGDRAQAGHETGLYSEDEAAIWVAALNRDPSKQGRVYWAEPVTK